MAMHNPKGRVNYEPNSWSRDENNPRACPNHGYKSASQPLEGDKLRYRSETFADHYSQARQFYISQTPTEQQHIQNAFVFELSKVETLAIRERMVSHLLNVDQSLAEAVADGLGLLEMPDKAEAALPTNEELKPSDALSILKNAPGTFKGRKLGILTCNGVKDQDLSTLTSMMDDEGALYEIVAPTIQGVKTQGGQLVSGHQKVNGGPSVLYDAVAILLSEDEARNVAALPEAKDFIMDAHAHCKFIIFNEAASALLEATKLNEKKDGGYMELAKTDSKAMLSNLRKLRYWAR